MEYPFKPKSTSFLERGQFWAVPLENGLFGCGVVVAKKNKANGKIESRLFLAGLLDWFGSDVPTSRDIESASFIEQGFAHIKTITETGGEILGVSNIKFADSNDVVGAFGFSTWGYHYILALANKHVKVNKAFHRTSR